MTRNDVPARTEACLDDASLRAYHLGTIPEALLDRVVNHLAGCRRCESALESLRGADDAFLHNLRQYLRDTPHMPGDGAGETGPDLTARPRHPANVLAGLGTLPRPFGNYDVLENLAIGGMSFIFKARQRHPNRLVALKIPQYAPLPGTEAFQRFQREIEAIAQLQHDHIVRIYECGEEEGLPYFSMEYMEQGSLAAKLAGSPLPEREAAQLVQTLARAVQFAHGHGIIHRDLKPANVLLGPAGAVKLTDFGLAKWLDGDHDLTQSHAILGTAKYMAPEQARGDAKIVGVTTDVYGLGTILYECLTGRAPFRANSQAELLALVETAPPVPPSKLRRGLCRNLEAICLKCLEKDPSRRYASAERLANDLENWLNHRPTEARPLRWLVRVYRTARRHAIAILLAAALLGGLAAAYVLDPERPIRQIEHQLAKGQPVTLIGETGSPAWFRVSVGEDSSRVSLAEDGTLSVNSWSLCLVELARKPPQAPFRFHAEIRHEKGDQLGEVGIYLGHCFYPTSKPKSHVFMQLSFDDVHDHLELRSHISPHNPQPPLSKGNPVRLSPHIYLPEEQERYRNRRVGGVEGAFFKFAGVGGGPWHEIEVIITAKSIEAFRNGQRVGELSADAMVKGVSSALTRMRKELPNNSWIHNLPLNFASLGFHLRGSLGLYVYRGSARFHSVGITPIIGSH